MLLRLSTFSAILFLALLLLSSSARASTICDYYRKHAPDLYKIVCSNKRSSTRPAGASSSFSSAFNLTAASLPSEPTSYGLETLGNYARSSGEKAPIFSLVKGYTRFGTGISTGSNNTFYGDDVLQRQFGTPDVSTFKPLETPKSSLPNLNIGTSFKVMEFGPGITTKLGVSVRHNRTTATWGGGPALTFSSTYLSVGAAFTRERISNLLDPITFTTYQVSGRVWILELEYNQLKNNSIFQQKPIHIYTLTMSIKRLILTAAQRTVEYYDEQGTLMPTPQFHYGVQYLFSKSFSAGALYNYIPGATTLGVQVFL